MSTTTCTSCTEESVFLYLALGYLVAHAPLATQIVVSTVFMILHIRRAYQGLCLHSPTTSIPGTKHRRSLAVHEEPSQVTQWRYLVSEKAPDPFKMRGNLSRFDARAPFNRSFGTRGQKLGRSESDSSTASTLERITEE
ncbi:hypothetical protein BDN72DRAFT_839474 [Pluteus cervinus]|uniref:Uncharacterized protein n=1 Tax=Pluteus cervinus TaxID=181527 RepID=A0ACD3AWG3_9AGAR|nr:hypothetical protein BDN72DRAFT_839474 [Pluteus cervinus]